MEVITATKDMFSLVRQRRGWTDEYLRSIDDPTHAPLKDMDLMVSHLKRIHDGGELIVVLPDIDMDGITSGVLGYAGLCELGFNTGLYLPDPAKGHGFGPAQVEQIRELYPEVGAIITCDTGIDSHAGIDAAVRAGLTMLVTDHHKQIEREDHDTSLLGAHVVIDPVRLDETYAHPGICGAHVLYQVLEAYANACAPGKVHDVALLKLFAGIGTVSDVMPLLYENRQLVKDSISLARLLFVPARREDPNDWSSPLAFPDVEESTLLQLLRTGDHHPMFVAAFEGFATLMGCFAQMGKLRSMDDVDEGFYGFYLAPAFNSIRRMGDVLDRVVADAQAPGAGTSDSFQAAMLAMKGTMDGAFRAFFAPDRRDYIQAVLALNAIRKEMVVEYVEGLVGEDAVQPWAPYAYVTEAPSGMLGLLAANLMHRSGLPTAVLRSDGRVLSGSGRAPTWFPFNSVVNQAGFHAAGHEHAFGMRIGDVDDVTRLHDVVEDAVERMKVELAAQDTVVGADEPDLRLGPTPDCDATLEDLDALAELVTGIESLAPFGHEFRPPVIEVVLSTYLCQVDVIGSSSQHLRISADNGMKCLWWNQAERLEEIREKIYSRHEPVLRLRGSLGLNTFKGHTSVNFFVDEML